MTVLLTRVDLFDLLSFEEKYEPKGDPPDDTAVSPFRYDPQLRGQQGTIAYNRTAPVRSLTSSSDFLIPEGPNRKITTPPSPHLTKYWNQRHRLFSKFDQGIQLDEEGWYSVTPEQIAHHVARKTIHNLQSQQTDDTVYILDAFCGCGGNAIAFAQQQPQATVIGLDVDRSKLRRAAHNASLYQIPPGKLLLIECNVLFVLEHCYRNQAYVLDQPVATPEQAQALMESMPPPVPTERTPGGYQIGGIDLLPPKVHCVFMDPPWGGVDYSVFGNQGYDLQENMKIYRSLSVKEEESNNDFFDKFSPQTTHERKAQFNCSRAALSEKQDYVDGQQLLDLAAQSARYVVYDVPRNTSRESLAHAALAAGYRGHCRIEENHLNGRLKTVTAYFGLD